jgi:hypothetical protein
MISHLTQLVVVFMLIRSWMISKSCSRSVGHLENPDATDISDTSAIMSIRLNLLLTTLIYPAIRPGDRLGLQTHSVPVLQDDVSVLCLPPAFAAVPQYLVHTLGVLRSTTPAADFRYAIGSPLGSLSSRRNTQRISRGNPGDFRCTTVGSTRIRTTTDRGLRCVLPARPIVSEPISACCSSARIFALGFLPGWRYRFPRALG